MDPKNPQGQPNEQRRASEGYLSSRISSQGQAPPSERIKSLVTLRSDLDRARNTYFQGEYETAQAQVVELIKSSAELSTKDPKVQEPLVVKARALTLLAWSARDWRGVLILRKHFGQQWNCFNSH